MWWYRMATLLATPGPVRLFTLTVRDRRDSGGVMLRVHRRHSNSMDCKSCRRPSPPPHALAYRIRTLTVKRGYGRRRKSAVHEDFATSGIAQEARLLEAPLELYKLCLEPRTYPISVRTGESIGV